MSDATVVVLAGLNRSGEPMPYPARYSDDLLSGVKRVGVTLHTEATGLGRWDGQSERVIVLAGSVSTDKLGLLQAVLADIAYEYGQEAIGLVTDRTDTLVKPQPMFRVIG